LPSDPTISWQGHLFGAAGGVLAMWLVAKANRLDRAQR
jgi:membrane associated rhomboid family serine protease